MPEHMSVMIEVWPVAADDVGLWLVSGTDGAWRPDLPVPADSEPHAELELLLWHHAAPDPVFLHSTSWRVEGPRLVVTYLAVLPCDDLVRGRWPEALPVSPDLLPAVGKPARHGPTEPPMPRDIDVLHHGLRHLAFLRENDSTARAALSVGWWAGHLGTFAPTLATMYEHDQREVPPAGQQ